MQYGYQTIANYLNIHMKAFWGSSAPRTGRLTRKYEFEAKFHVTTNVATKTQKRVYDPF